MSSPSAEGMRMRLAEEAEKHRNILEAVGEVGLDFGEAMEIVLKGGKVSREAWNAPEEYVFLRADVVHLHKGDGSEHKLIVGSGDLAGADWVEV